MNYTQIEKLVSAAVKISNAAVIAAKAYAKSVEDGPEAPPYVINLKGDFTEGHPKWPNV